MDERSAQPLGLIGTSLGVLILLVLGGALITEIVSALLGAGVSWIRLGGYLIALIALCLALGVARSQPHR